MKTAEEILSKHNPFQNNNGNTEYFTQNIIDAMEEYANQSKWISVDIIPEFDGEYLCMVEIEQECMNIWVRYEVIEFSFMRWVTKPNTKVTHYQKTPNPPIK